MSTGFFVVLPFFLVFALVTAFEVSDTKRKPKLEGKPLRDQYVALTPPPTQDKEVLLTEYKETQLMLQHYDNLNWQIGSILVGSNIIALGFLSNVTNDRVLTGAALAGTFSLFAWILWFFRHMAIYNVKNDRLCWIEEDLNMYQHRMVGYAGKKPRRWLGRIPGNYVSIVLWAGLSIAWLTTLV
jgi:hypothetical protein